ncbi:hypothetical protein ABWH96_10895 [Marivirga tractuosa]|uniref:hypothetical protein n=1 Tax=Marivirga tractuosa TaxID=1006 RepID=UPI0035D09701
MIKKKVIHWLTSGMFTISFIGISHYIYVYHNELVGVVFLDMIFYIPVIIAFAFGFGQGESAYYVSLTIEAIIIWLAIYFLIRHKKSSIND